MENNQNNYRINPVIACLVVIQIVFMIFVGITIYNIFKHQIEVPKIKINNYSAIPAGRIIGDGGQTSNAQDIKFNLSDFIKDNIEGSIYDIVLMNNKGSIENNGAKIREGSAYYVYIKGLDTYFLNFIVDIEDLKQSYRFTWRWSNDISGQVMPATSMMIFCLKEDEMIYNDFGCKDNYDSRGLDIVAYELLRYKMFSNFTVGLSNVYSGAPLSLGINVSSDDEAVEAAEIQEVSDYLSNLGLRLNDFEYDTQIVEIAN